MVIAFIAKLMLKILPEKPIIPDTKRNPDEGAHEYQKRVPLKDQPPAENEHLSYLNTPMSYNRYKKN